MKSRRALALLLSLVLCAGMLPLTAWAVDGEPAGDGSPASYDADSSLEQGTDGNMGEGERRAPCGHQWGEWEETTAPSCTSDGEKKRTCALCGGTETSPVAGGHSWQTAEDGTREVCKTCGEERPVPPSEEEQNGEPSISAPRRGMQTRAGGDEEPPEATPAVKVVSGESEVGYESLQDAIDDAGSGDTVMLLKDAVGSVTVNKEVTLNISEGVTLTNTEGKHTIVVGKDGVLTIEGKGTVDNVSNSKSALNNEGTVKEIAGCTFMRSAENKQTDGTGDNTYYTVRNIGTIELISGGTFENKGTYSSCFINGSWNKDSSKSKQGTIGEITGGTFRGGKIVLKNDPYCSIGSISGAVIEGSKVYKDRSFIGLLNYGTIEIVTNTTITSSGQAVYTSGFYSDASITLGEGVKATAENNTQAIFSGVNEEHKSETTITGGKYYAVKPTGSYETLSGTKDTLFVSGGTFSAGAKGVLDTCVVDKYVSRKNSDTTWTVVPYEDTLVAKIVETGERFTTLQAAFDKVTDSQTVEVLKDCGGALLTGSKKVTLNIPANVTVGTRKKSDGIANEDHALRIEGTNLTITGEGTIQGPGYGIRILNNTTVTVDGNVKIKAKTYPIFIIGPDSKLTVNSGELSGACAISGNGTEAYWGTEITINGGTLNGSITTVFHPQVGTLTINGGTINNTGTAVEMRAGTLEIPADSTAAITADYTYDYGAGKQYYGYSQWSNGSGGTTLGAGIALSQHNTEQPIVATIAGGTIAGYHALVEIDVENSNPSSKGVQLSITGGTFIANGNMERAAKDNELSADKYKKRNSLAHGESRTVVSENLTGFISGGYFSDDLDAEGSEMLAYLAAGCASHSVGEPAGYFNVHRPNLYAENAYGHDAVGHWQGCRADGCIEGKMVTAHAWNGGVVTTQPTYSSTGVRTYTCTVCGHTRTESIAALTGGGGGGGSYRPSTRPGGTVEITDPDVPLAQPFPFIDVEEDDWFFEGVKYAFEEELMKGTSDITFSPYDETTRGMIVTILYRMEGSPAVTAAAPYTDIEAGRYYSEAVAWGDANDIVLGFGDGTFRPDIPITREQMAAMLYRYADFKGWDVTKLADLSAFPDAETISDYAVEPMQWANARELITGSDGKLLPHADALRAQAAVILMRFRQKAVIRNTPTA